MTLTMSERRPSMSLLKGNALGKGFCFFDPFCQQQPLQLHRHPSPGPPVTHGIRDHPHGSTPMARWHFSGAGKCTL